MTYASPATTTTTHAQRIVDTSYRQTRPVMHHVSRIAGFGTASASGTAQLLQEGAVEEVRAVDAVEQGANYSV